MTADCRLLPYTKREILSAQDMMEKMNWGVRSFNIPSLWQSTEGEGVVVAVIDSGCDLEHPDLKDNLLGGINIIDPTKLPEDDGNHGTHVAGILAASRNHMGVIGIAPKAKIRPIKVLDEYGDGTIEDVVAGIRWAVAQNVDMISLSIGTKKPDRRLRWAIKAAQKKGIPLFVAAGNMGESEHLLYPANYPETIAIGAIGKGMKRADFANTGKHLDFLAPGVEILSTVPESWWAILSGSSMAQPFVCGLSALLLSYARAHPESGIVLEKPDDYRQFFKRHTVDVIGEQYAGDSFYQGFGIITVDKLAEKWDSAGDP